MADLPAALLLFLSLPICLSSGFLFSSHDPPYCYELDLERCFRDAFIEMHRNMLDQTMKEIPHSLSVPQKINATMMSKMDGIKHMHMCRDMKKYSACFEQKGCTKDQASKIASTQFHMVFGRILPVQAFLSFLGYGKEMCERECSFDSLMACRRTLRRSSESQEETLFKAAADLSGQISSEERRETYCEEFKGTLRKLMLARREVCGDISKCTCMEDRLQRGINFCRAGCEQMLNESMESERAHYRHFPNGGGDLPRISIGLMMPLLILIVRLL